MSTELAVMEKDITTINDKAAELVIVDQCSYLEAGDLFTTAKKMVREIEAFFKPLKQAQDAAKKKLLDAERAELAKVQPAIDRLNTIMTAWNIEQEKIRKAEEERLRKEAEKAEEERKLADAIAAEQAGETAIAEEILDEPTFTPPPVVEKAVPKVVGMTMRTNWSAEVTNLRALIQAVAQGKAPIQCLQADMTFLNAQARAGKGAITYPGVVMRDKQAMTGARR